MIDVTTPEALVVRFHVPGLPVPGGSKRAFVVKGRAVVTDVTLARGRDWRARVAHFAREVHTGPPLSGPLSLEVTFTLPRPRSHFGTGRNARTTRPRAPDYPTGRPDATKLTRALEDALTGLLWHDDAQVVTQHVAKRYGPPGASVAIRPLAPDPEETDR